LRAIPLFRVRPKIASSSHSLFGKKAEFSRKDAQRLS
jgi:hypothetical protein